MLVLTRKVGEQIKIGNDITVTVLEVLGSKVRIGIDAPEILSILRGELFAKQVEKVSDPLEKPITLHMAAIHHQN